MMHNIVLQGLLHDIGKLIRRAILAARNLVGDYRELENYFMDALNRKIDELVDISGIYEVSEDIVNVARDIIRGLLDGIKDEVLEKRDIKFLSHDRIYSIFVGVIEEYLAKLGLKLSETIDGVVRIADYFSAGERSIKGGRIESFLQEMLQANDWNMPYVSPLWILKSVNTNDLEKILREFLRTADLSHLQKLVNRIKGERLFMVPKPLCWNLMSRWSKAEPIEYSMQHFSRELLLKVSKSYIDLFLEFIIDFASLLSLVERDAIDVKGFINTLIELLKRIMLFVPAATYDSIMPDTSLYAHSVSVAALVSAFLQSGGDYRFRLLLVDIRGIQKFIAQIKRNDNASKIMRGKSTLIELIVDSIASKIISDLNLTDANIVIRSGGTVLIIVPANINADSIDRIIREINEKYKGLLIVYYALSDEVYTKPDIREIFVENIKTSKGTISHAIISLARNALKYRSRLRALWKPMETSIENLQNKERPKIHGYYPRYSRFTCGYIFPAIQIVNRCFPEKGHDPVMTSAFCIFF